MIEPRPLYECAVCDWTGENARARGGQLTCPECLSPLPAANSFRSENTTWTRAYVLDPKNI